MTTHFDNYSYHRPSTSPPVSPKTLPHGHKRKASTQDDELESNAHISNSFKKLRLSTAKRPNAIALAPIGVSYRDAEPNFQPLNGHSGPVGRESASLNHAQHDDDFMPVDDTADRVWVHDLDAEIREIEAEEASNNYGIQISEAGREYSKVPEHILRQSPKMEDPAAGLQVILYKDPISISVPQEEDAVRKAIIETRRRMREKQYDGRGAELAFDPDPEFSTQGHDFLQPSPDNGAEDDMDID